MSNEASNSNNKSPEKSPEKSPLGQCWNNENSTFFQTVMGACVLFGFLIVWFASVGCPILGVIWILNGQYVLVYALLAATFMAYLPWQKGYISGLFTTFAQYNTMYYHSCSVVYQSKESIPRTSDDDKEQEEQRPMLYAVHPHGAFCMGWSVLFCSKTMNKGMVRFCFSPVLFASPLFRLWCRLVGRPGSAAKASMIGYMKGMNRNSSPSGRPDHLALPPGGFEEATLTCLDKDRVYIKKRVGFVKLALQNGYNLVPVYSFGENQTYSNVQGLWKLRLWLNNLGVPTIVVFGSWMAPLLPKRHPRGLKVVVGEPLVLPLVPNPTREVVKLWHDKYVAALAQLFEDHKEDYYGPEIAKTAKLELW